MKLRSVVSYLSLILTAVSLHAKEVKTQKQTEKEFFVYTERGSKLNHSIPSGYMGDWSDIKMNQAWEKNPGAGKYCIRVEYSAERKQNAGWSGVYWQTPANNWGDKRGGYNLEGYKKFTFMARGEMGGEVIDKFGVGGITGQLEEGDTDQADTGMIELGKEWKRYEIDLKGKDLSHIIGPFLWVANAESNPAGFTIYIDEAKYEK